MTKDEALKMALEALVSAYQGKDKTNQVTDAINVLRLVIDAENISSKPVAWINSSELLVMKGNAYAGAKDWRVNLGLEPEKGDVGLYTTQPQRPWVGLTEEELYEIYDESDDGSSPCGVCGACSKCKIEVAIARAIESKIKEKNR